MKDLGGEVMQVSDCEALRREIKATADKVRVLCPWGGEVDDLTPSEALANVMLAYRHLEDASMRLGKAIQALDGGTSVYDKTQVPAS
jgi:hypothetical protein